MPCTQRLALLVATICNVEINLFFESRLVGVIPRVAKMRRCMSASAD
jgi:hypothetical protein